MYKEIVDFANLVGASIKSNRKSSKIIGYIHLSDKGDYLGIEVLDKDKQYVKEIPDFGSFSRVAGQSNPICEKASYILDKTTKKYPYWYETMERGSSRCDSLNTVWQFISKFNDNSKFEESVFADFKNSGLKADSVISFSIDGTPIEDMTDWDEWVNDEVKAFNEAKGRTSNDLIISSITGTLQESVPAESCPDIKNIPNDIKAAFGIGSGVYVTSMGDKSYQSYGFDAAKGSQMGLDDANAIVAGFEYLLSNPEHRNKDFNTVYFYDKPDIENLLSTAIEQEDDELLEQLENDIAFHQSKLSEILEAVRTGVEPVPVDEGAHYHIMTFNAPSRGRFMLSNVHNGSYAELEKNLYKWYSDTRIIKYSGKEKHEYVVKKLYSVLLNSISNLESRNKSEDVNDELGGIKMGLLQSVYEGKQLPRMLYDRAVRHSIRSLLKGSNIRNNWLQVIKCYLIREGETIMPELSNTNNIPYACGRLFALYEQMQWLYNGKGINKSLSQSYFDATIKQPSVFFPKLASMANVYMSKIKNQYFYKQLLGEITGIIGTEFPTKFNDLEKGSFILGFYQQQADFMKKSNESDTTEYENEDIDTVEEE